VDGEHDAKAFYDGGDDDDLIETLIDGTKFDSKHEVSLINRRLTARDRMWTDTLAMRIVVFPIAIAMLATSPARADDCVGEVGASGECNPRWFPWMSLSTGWLADRFDPKGRTFDVAPLHAVNTIGQYAGDRISPMRGNGLFLDVRVHLLGPLWYFGVGTGAAEAAPPASRFVARGEALTWSGAWILTMTGIIGMRIPLGPVSLRSEIAAGAHGAVLTSTTQQISAESDVLVIEPRAGVELALSRMWALEAFAGVNLLDRSERMLGVGIAFSTAGYTNKDGVRPPPQD
jgi:hypothetical protein